MNNVLISPAGTEIGREIWLSLRYQKTVKLFLASSDYGNHARYNGEWNPLLLAKNEDEGLQALRACYLLYDIHLIFPVSDGTRRAIANHRIEIKEKISCSDDAGSHVGRYKCQTSPRGEDIIPTLCRDNRLEEIESWSVFIKSDLRIRGDGARKINDRSTFEIQLCDKGDVSISESRCATEYSVDCFTDKKYDNLFPPYRPDNGIQTGPSIAPFFLYEPHKAQATVSYVPCQCHSRRQHTVWQHKGSFRAWLSVSSAMLKHRDTSLMRMPLHKGGIHE